MPRLLPAPDRRFDGVRVQDPSRQHAAGHLRHRVRALHGPAGSPPDREPARRCLGTHRPAPAGAVAPDHGSTDEADGPGVAVERLPRLVLCLSRPAAVDADDLHQSSHALLRLRHRGRGRRGQPDPPVRRPRRRLGHALVRPVAGRRGCERQRREDLRSRRAANARGQGARPQSRWRRTLQQRQFRTDRLQPADLAGVPDGTRLRPGSADVRPLGRRHDVPRRRGRRQDTGRESPDSRQARASPSTSSAGNSCSAESPTP